ncbi:LuxR C-terminal-related transcriptional regulator [Methylocystis heyeri]|uniref:Response regulator n=1 Tax=Methylocystis heyeri TaxID=391905 RepID=A0A6B8KD18_9HYPH|nr:response regulator transcription factor [Methylocystis heyeri]QGM44428.1 response regulator [Methylocystis heyeri]
MAKFKSKIPTIIIAKNSLFREGLSRILSSERYEVVASTSILDIEVMSCLRQTEISLLVLGAGLDAEETAGQLNLYKDQQHNGYSVIITEQEKPLEIVSALQAGANACLTKDATSDALLKTIELVMLGETVVPQGMLSHLLKCEESWLAETGTEQISSPKPELDLVCAPHPPFDPRPPASFPQLSAQEKRILSCLIVGDSNKMIARKVDIAEATVKVHVKAIFRKLGLKNRTQAAVWALNQGSHTAGPPSQLSAPSAARLDRGPSSTPALESELQPS